MKNNNFCRLFFVASFTTSFIILTMTLTAFSQEDLKGRWVGEWYSYTKSTTFKMELDINKTSPLEGVMFRSAKNPGKPRKHFADVVGEAKEGKVFFKLTGPDGYEWDFVLALKGRVLDGEGRTMSGRGRTSNVNLRLEKLD